ncbi:MAG: ABC transporter transmembrane domain-containing protein, partial [Planctomycetota bacterium]
MKTLLRRLKRRRQRLNALTRELLADLQEQTGTSDGDLRRLWNDYVRHRRWSLYILFLIMAVWGPLPLILPLLAKYNIDHVLMVETYPDGIPPELLAEQLGRLWVVILGGAAVYGVWAFFQQMRGWLSLRISHNMIGRLRKELYQKLQKLHVGFFDQTQTGRIMARVLDDVALIQQAITTQFSEFIGSGSKVAISLIVLFTLEWHLALIIAVSLPFYALAFALIQPRLRRNNIAISRLNSRMSGHTLERISAIQVIKAFAQETAEIAGLSHMSASNVRLGVRQTVLNQSLVLATNCLACIPVGLTLYLGMSWVRDGSYGMTLGRMLAFVGVVPMIYGPLATVTNLITYSEMVLVRVRRVFALLDEPEDVLPGRIHLSGIDGRIHLRNVTFCYPHQNEA